MSEGTKKFVFAIASFLAAILLWLYVVTAVAPEASTTVSGIPISIDGTIVLEERGLVITYQDVTTLSLSVNTSRVNLSKLKNGRVSAIRFSTLEAICRALDCQPGDILEYRPPEDGE